MQARRWCRRPRITRGAGSSEWRARPAPAATGELWVVNHKLRVVSHIASYGRRRREGRVSLDERTLNTAVSWATVQMSLVVEDCSKSWRRKLEKSVCQLRRGWMAVQQDGWRKSTGVSAEMAHQQHGWSMTTDTLVHCQVGRSWRRMRPCMQSQWRLISA